MPNVLAVDDELSNLLMIEEFLSDEDYEVMSVTDASAALEHLRSGQPVDAILLDRMMPGMSGMELLAVLKSSKSYRHIPVIMQTAAGTPTEIAEGIAAGVFYYLTKPFKRVALVSILRNALRDFSVYTDLQSELTTLNQSLQTIRSCTLALRSLQEVNVTSLLISRLFPDPESVVLGVRELLINAVEHGNAGISYDEKTALHQTGQWEEEIERRLALPENRHKQVRVVFERAEGEITLRIEDEGAGFDWRSYMSIDPQRFLDTHGRGIAMSQMLSFDRVEYVTPGNKVICTKRLGPPADIRSPDG